jgi:hypothetical protein
MKTNRDGDGFRQGDEAGVAIKFRNLTGAEYSGGDQL